MLPPAPARLSITNGWPRISPSFCPAMRAMMSVGPPGAKGMMTRTGFDGQGCACAERLTKNARTEARMRWVMASSFSYQRHGALVVAELEVALGRGRLAAPLALDLGPQREHVAEALEVELRVRRQPEGRVHQRVVGARRDVRLELEPFAQQPQAFVAVGRIARPAGRLDVAREVLFKRLGVGARPGPHDEGARRLV